MDIRQCQHVASTIPILSFPLPCGHHVLICCCSSGDFFSATLPPCVIPLCPPPNVLSLLSLVCRPPCSAPGRARILYMKTWPRSLHLRPEESGGLPDSSMALLKGGSKKKMERTMTNEGEEARCPGWIVGLEEEHGGK